MRITTDDNCIVCANVKEGIIFIFHMAFAANDNFINYVTGVKT